MRLRRRDIDACLKQGTGWINWPVANQTKNTKNMVCQLKSVEEVGKLWGAHFATHKDEYAAVAFVRPDVMYGSPFPTQIIPKLEVSILISTLVNVLLTLDLGFRFVRGFGHGGTLRMGSTSTCD